MPFGQGFNNIINLHRKKVALVDFYTKKNLLIMS